MFCKAAPRMRLVTRAADKSIFGSAITRTLRTKPGRSAQPSSSLETSSSNAPTNASVPSHGQSTKSSSSDVSSMLSEIDPAENRLLAPVHIPEDAKSVLRSDHPATNILAQSGLVVTRQIEMMNIFLGFEQANRYTIMDPQGNHVGYMAEHDGGIAKTMGRQWFRTHRSFTTHVFDKHAREVLRFHRPFSWINSRIRVYDPLEVGKYAPTSNATEVSTDVKAPNFIDGVHQISDMPMEAMRVVGEAQSEWAPLRRKYHLFLAHELEGHGPQTQTIGSEPIPSDLSSRQLQDIKQNHQTQNFAQFAYVNEPFLSWDFSLKGQDDRLIGSVNRNFRGFGREIFTDTGMYILRMDSAGLEDEAAKSHIVSQSHQGEKAYAETVGATEQSSGMTLDQRAVMLATAVTVDFDYFSRHSHGGGMFMPMWFGGGEAGGAAGAGAAGAEAGGAAAGVGVAEGAGAVVGGAGRAAGSVGAGAAESGIAGAGTLAGYEAMQQSRDKWSIAEGPSPKDFPQGNADPNSPQYGAGDDPQPPQPPQDGYDGGQASNDVWGSGDQDPWNASESPGGSGGEGGEGGGILSTLWDSFFGGD